MLIQCDDCRYKNKRGYQYPCNICYYNGGGIEVKWKPRTWLQNITNKITDCLKSR